MTSQDFPQRHVHRLNSVGHVDGFTDVLWEGKEGNDAVLVVYPGLANRRVLLVPASSKVDEGLVCFGGCGSGVHCSQVSRHCFAVFVGDVAQGSIT